MDATIPLTAPDAIAQHRATRRFDPGRQLADDLLARLLALATLAPSGFNLQPWRFLVVREPRNRQRLRACAFNQPKITEAPVIVLGYHHPHRRHLEAMLAEQVGRGVLTPDGAAEVRARATRTME